MALDRLEGPLTFYSLPEELLEGGSFTEKYVKVRKTLQKKLDQFSEDPSEKNTHDVRTAARRMNAALELFPRSVRRSKKVRDFGKILDKLMEESAIVRDLDVISGRLSRHSQSATRKIILEKIETNRKRHAKRAVEIASSALEISPPKGREVPVAKIRKRFKKRVNVLSGQINASLSKVLGDPSNVEDVHSLRKYCKRARYMFELVNADSQTDLALKSWQDVLGSIHDGDVTVEYLSKKLKKSSAPGEMKEMIATELRDRTHDYEKFVHVTLGR